MLRVAQQQRQDAEKQSRTGSGEELDQEDKCGKTGAQGAVQPAASQPGFPVTEENGKHDQRKQQIQDQQRDTAEHSARQRQTGQKILEALVRFSSYGQDTGDEEEHDPHGVVAKGHHPKGSEHHKDQGGSHCAQPGNRAEAEIEQQRRQTPNGGEQPAEMQQDAFRPAEKQQMQPHKRRQHQKRSLGQMPLLCQKSIAQAEAIRNGEVKSLVLIGTAVAALPEQKSPDSKKDKSIAAIKQADLLL